MCVHNHTHMHLNEKVVTFPWNYVLKFLYFSSIWRKAWGYFFSRNFQEFVSLIWHLFLRFCFYYYFQLNWTMFMETHQKELQKNVSYNITSHSLAHAFLSNYRLSAVSASLTWLCQDTFSKWMKELRITYGTIHHLY